MKYKTLLGGLAVALLVTGCSSPGTANKTTTTTTTTSNATNTASPNATGKKSHGTAKKVPAAKIVPVPTDWITMYNEARGYEFKVPQNYKQTDQSDNDVDLFIAIPPDGDSSKPMVLVVAFKNKSLSKDDLLKFAEKVLEGAGEKNITVSNSEDMGNDYSLATFTSVDKDNKKSKGKVLVATDVTDNYVMFIRTDEAGFSPNEKTIDEIWGSFEMYSGGSSSNS